MVLKIAYEDLDKMEWGNISPYTLCELYDKNGMRFIQVYPHNVLKADTSKVIEFDSRGGKRYFCSDVHSNGFSPKNILGTCRGSVEDFLRVVDIIRENGCI